MQKLFVSWRTEKLRGTRFECIVGVVALSDDEPLSTMLTTTSDVDPADVRKELERIRQSRTVGPSKKLIELLNFVVEAALNGEAEQLKETMVGTLLFGRAPDYDPKADPVVRNQAWRLRSKLAEYYASEGAEDALLIQVPKGRYVPKFRRRDAHESGPLPSDS